MSRGRSLALLFLSTSLLPSCGNNSANPFAQVSPSRPPAADAVLLFVSGSWAGLAGAPRELFAVNADGSQVERLTTCTQTEQPCDILTFSPSNDRSRIAVVRTTPDAEPGTAALYFMDLGRSVETVITDQRRVGAVDWSRGGTALIFSAADPVGNEDLYTIEPNGANEQVLFGQMLSRERNPRFNPNGSTAIFEGISNEAPGTIAVLAPSATGLTAVLLTPGGDASQPLSGTPYFVGSDADPSYAPDASGAVFRRLTSTGNGGLGTWDLLVVRSTDEDATPVLTGGSVYRGAPDWGPDGIVFVEIDADADLARLVVIQPDGSGRRVLFVEDAGYRMASPRWLR